MLRVGIFTLSLHELLVGARASCRDIYIVTVFNTTGQAHLIQTQLIRSST